MNNHSRRLATLEGQLAQREQQAEMNDLEQVAAAARAKIDGFLAMYRRGEPIPEPAIRHESRHHEAMRWRLSEMRERLERYAELRDTYGIR